MTTISLSNVSLHRGNTPTDLLSRILALLAAEPAGGKTFSIEGLSLEIPHGKTLVVLGPSHGPDGYEAVDMSTEEPWASLRNADA